MRGNLPNRESELPRSNEFLSESISPAMAAPQITNILEIMRNRIVAMGITDFEAAVPNMLVELFYRQCTDLLTEADRVAQSAKRPQITESDIRNVNSILVLRSPSRFQVDVRQLPVLNAAPIPQPEFAEWVMPDKETLLKPNFQLGQWQPTPG
jgi:histone H3/H4